MNKTDYADYLCRTWPVLTTPEDVLELGQVLQRTWESCFEDREDLERNLRAMAASQFRVKSWQQLRILRDAMGMFAKRIREIPRAKRTGFWDL